MARYTSSYNLIQRQAMLCDFYERLDSAKLAAIFVGSIRLIRDDPRERRRGLAPDLSQRLFTEVCEAASKSQKEIEVLLLNLEEDADGAATGRQARRYQNGETSLSIETARDVLSRLSWGSLVDETGPHPQWLDVIQKWWMVLDSLEAASETMLMMSRRTDSSHPEQALMLFRDQLSQISRRAELIGQANLQRTFGQPADVVLAQICHTLSDNVVQNELT